MGSYLNPGYRRFAVSIKGLRYVDKTMLIDKTNEWMDSSRKLICMSRPRRFGKTMAANMLCAYYSKGCQSEHIFRDLNIGSARSFLEHLNKHDTIYIDIGGEYSITDRKKHPRLIRIVTDKILGEMKAGFPEVALDDEDSLGEAILKVYMAKGAKFIIILDEYDALVRENVDRQLLEDYLLFLNGLFKNETVLEAISLAYLTGILPVIKDKAQSKLNNFDPQYTFLNAGPLKSFMGFTSDETKEICEEFGIDFGECQRWYNGYRLNGIEIYSPKSVMRAAEEGDFDNYWGQTSTFRVISDRLDTNFDGMVEDVTAMIAGESVSVNANAYLNTVTDFVGKDEIFTYLIHLGYLSYDKKSHSCRIPNREIQMEWIRAIRNNEKYSTTNSIINESEKLLKATIDGDEEAVCAALDNSHIHATSIRSYKNEDGLQCAIYLAYIYALNEYTVIREASSGKGIADMIYIPVNKSLPALIIELKRNQGVGGAIKQIKDKQYSESLRHYYGNLLFVGIDYDERSKKHSCRIERFVKEEPIRQLSVCQK